MKGGTNLADELILAVGPGAIGEQNCGDLRVEIDPERTAAKAQVSDGVWGKVPACRGLLRRRIPAQRPRTAFRPLPLREFFNDCCVEADSDLPCGEDLAGETEQIGHIGKEAGVAGNAIQNPGVLVLHFALDAAMAERLIFFGGRNLRAQPRRRIESGCISSKWCENFPLDPCCQMIRESGLRGLAEQDEAGVGVLVRVRRARLRAAVPGRREAGHGGCDGAEEFDIAGQAGVVRQQMTKGDIASMLCCCAADDEAGQQFAQRRIEIEDAALVEQHGSGRRGNNLGDAGDVEDGVRRDCGKASSS